MLGEEVKRPAPVYSLVNKAAKKKRKESKEAGRTEGRNSGEGRTSGEGRSNGEGRSGGERRQHTGGDGGEAGKRPLVSQVSHNQSSVHG